MTIDLQRTKDALIQRGVELGAPNLNSKIDKLSSDLNIMIGTGFKAVYTAFDGFSSYDPISYLRLWSLDEIGRNYLTHASEIESGWLVIGDFLMESDFVVSNVAQEASTVKLLYDNRVGPSDIGLFLKELSGGRFDFVRQ